MSEQAGARPWTPVWLNAVLPLGSVREGRWSPVGLGCLVTASDAVWLVTKGTLTETELVAWVERETLFRLVDEPEVGLTWLRHPDRNLAARLFPVDESWNLKAFDLKQCAGPTTLAAGLPSLGASCAWGLSRPEQGPPRPLVLDGVLASAGEPAGIYLSTTPLLPDNSGAPLLLRQPDGGTLLAGIAEKALFLTRDEGPSVELSQGVTAETIVSLLRSPEALERVQKVKAAGA